MRVTLLSRVSDLAQVQAAGVERALISAVPTAVISRVVSPTAGDRQPGTALTGFEDKGAFTADLSDSLIRGDVDIVVHSWKDLPIEPRPGTVVAGTLERADPRDVLLLRPGITEARPDVLRVLSSSPRRAWMLADVLPDLLPWRPADIRAEAVRGNVPTRLRKMLVGEADGLVVAKAALDRLLAAPRPFTEARETVREALDACPWMVLPLRSWPTAPAQGALALEVARNRPDLAEIIRGLSHGPTAAAVRLERAILAGYGGGCHAPVGVTAMERAIGRVISVRARTGDGVDSYWELERPQAAPDRTETRALWPRPGEPRRVERRPVQGLPVLHADTGLWIARADALPNGWNAGRFIWAAGDRTWQRLAARGVWVHGCADGLGDEESPAIDGLAGRVLTWRRLTHRTAAEADPAAIGTYEIDRTLPADLDERTHFYWMSGGEFLEALERFPIIRDRWHASGPGRTHRTISETLGSSPRIGVWLDYEAWVNDVTRG